MTYPFTDVEFQRAHQEWGCNCGPGSLAFALCRHPDFVRGLIPGFEKKRYTSPSMMEEALNNSGVKWSKKEANGGRVYPMFFSVCPTLVRVQWTGPWTAPGANPRWAYRQTHWICCWMERNQSMVFDINGGIRTFESWKTDVVPPLLKCCVPRHDGGWFPTDCWRVTGIRDAGPAEMSFREFGPRAGDRDTDAPSVTLARDTSPAGAGEAVETRGPSS